MRAAPNPSRRTQRGPELRFHDLRHTCAALLIANGRHMEETKDHLGHPSIRVTSDRHGHLFPRTPQELADGLDETYRNAASAGAADLRPLRH
jgi:integrase